MRRFAIGLVGFSLSAAVLVGQGGGLVWQPRPASPGVVNRDRSFQRVGTFANYHNNPDIAGQTVSEIVAATADGRLLVYTDGAMGAIGLIDISNPSAPQPAGKVAFTPGHEPTSVDVLANRYALVGVNSSVSFTSPSGYLAVVDLASRAIVRQIDLGGQPDAVKISHDGRYAAIAIENERNELLCVGGALDGIELDEDDEDVCVNGGGVFGGLPQTQHGNPAGYLAVVAIQGAPPSGWTRTDVSLSGLSLYGPEDPEPEFVDINTRNHAVVTLQENNHVVVVDLEDGTVLDHFPAGTVTLNGVDADEDGLIAPVNTLSNVPREPDAVAWVPVSGNRFNIATANEGDLFGGTRGFSLFGQDGVLAFDSGSAFETTAVRHGHYPEDRSENKGSEPEAIEYGQFGGTDYLFVGSERGSFIGVYELDRQGHPSLAQILPAPLGPEGLLAIPHRNLLIASGEEDDPSFGVRSTVMIYELQRGAPVYPEILSGDSGGMPIAWSALSGMVAAPDQPDTLLAVWDSYFSESRIFRIDVSAAPALITDALTIQGGRGNFDPEGIAVAPDLTMWIASEGNASDSRPNLLLQLDALGNVLAEVGLPPEILACRAASTNRGTLGSGFEGVAVVPDGPGTYKLFVAQQRGWDYTTSSCEHLDDDGGGLNANGEPNWTRVWIYDPATDMWDHVAWELAPKPARASWVGLSEISLTPWGEFILIERDNRTGDFGSLKTLVKVTSTALDDGLVSRSDKGVFDLMPALEATNGWITDKPEGVAVLSDGRTYVVTDNDGVEDWSGESWFLSLGPYYALFR